MAESDGIIPAYSEEVLSHYEREEVDISEPKATGVAGIVRGSGMQLSEERIARRHDLREKNKAMTARIEKDK